MCKRRLTVLLSILLVSIMTLAIMVTPAVAYADYPLQVDDAEITSALDYLRGIQAADGSIGSYSDSAWAVMAIAAAGELPDRWQVEGVSVVDYLRNNAALLSGEFNLGTAYARVVLAIIAAGENPSAFGPGDATYAPGGDYLSRLKELHNGVQFTDGFGSEELLNDDFWGLIAVIAARESLSSPLVTTTKTFIKDNRAEDGGWCWGTAGNPYYSGSDADDTAAAIMALVAAGENPGSAIINDGFSYLSSQQDVSGGFLSWGAANLGSTNFAVNAMNIAMRNPLSSYWIPGTVNPVDYILDFQEAEGSFFDPGAWTPAREKNTANSIVSLLGKSYPVRYYHIVSVGGSACAIDRTAIMLPWFVLGIALVSVLFITFRWHTVGR
jgi:iron complex transport system substrate-binding protein